MLSEVYTFGHVEKHRFSFKDLTALICPSVLTTVLIPEKRVPSHYPDLHLNTITSTQCSSDLKATSVFHTLKITIEIEKNANFDNDIMMLQ